MHAISLLRVTDAGKCPLSVGNHHQNGVGIYACSDFCVSGLRVRSGFTSSGESGFDQIGYKPGGGWCLCAQRSI